MKYKVQEHEQVTKEYAVYMTAPNGEVCKRIASCREKKDAELIASMLNSAEAAKRAR